MTSLKRHWDIDLTIQDLQDKVRKLEVSQRQGIGFDSSLEALTGCKKNKNPLVKEQETMAPLVTQQVQTHGNLYHIHQVLQTFLPGIDV